MRVEVVVVANLRLINRLCTRAAIIHRLSLTHITTGEGTTQLIHSPPLAEQSRQAMKMLTIGRDTLATIISTNITIEGETRRRKLEARRRALLHSFIEGQVPPITTQPLRAVMELMSSIVALVTPLLTAKAREVVIIQLRQASLMQCPCMAVEEV